MTRFGLASLMVTCAPLAVATPARADFEYQSFVSAPEIADITLAPGRSAELPVPLTVSGNYDAEGIFLAIESLGERPLTLTPPTGATCTGDAPMLCYLPETITPGQTSETWGASNPFRVTAPTTTPPGTYVVSLTYSPANTSYRNLGRNSDGSWKITPTVPITQSVWSGDHMTDDQSIKVTVTAGPTPTPPSPSAAQPTPTPTPTRQSADGDGTVKPTGTSSPGGGVGGGNQSGEELPVTGNPITALAGGGLLLLVVGATVMGLARRRRTAIVVE